MITVTGHGLKDTATALEGFGPLIDTVVDADVVAAAALPASARTGVSRSSSRGPVRVTSPRRRRTSGPATTPWAWRWPARRARRPRRRRRDGRRGGGRGRGDAALDETHLVVGPCGQPSRRCRPPSGPAAHCTNVFPHARGLGSSSAAIVGGLALARALVDGGRLLSDQGLFALAADIEGHPDNVAPAFFGGFVDLGREADAWLRRPLARRPAPRVVVFVPPTSLSTELARSLLPAVVPHADAAADAGRAALLVTALAGAPEHLLARPATTSTRTTGGRRCRVALPGRRTAATASPRWSRGRPVGARLRRGPRSGAAAPTSCSPAVPAAGRRCRSASPSAAYESTVDATPGWAGARVYDASEIRSTDQERSTHTFLFVRISSAQRRAVPQHLTSPPDEGAPTDAAAGIARTALNVGRTSRDRHRSESAASAQGAPEHGPAKKRGGGLSTMLLADLKQLAGGLGISGSGSMKKAQLVAAIKAAQGWPVGWPAGGQRGPVGWPVGGQSGGQSGAKGEVRRRRNRP